MTTYLVTGCAGFIGTTFVHYMLNRYTDIKIINLDALTYAGNLENLKDLEDDERHIFVHGNICDKELVATQGFRAVIGDRIEKLCKPLGVEIAYAFQERTDVPDFLGKEKLIRPKPWGTGHAVLCAAEHINSPFAVINADDYYGKNGFSIASSFLEEHPDSYALIGYILKNTLSDNGGVTRGICSVDQGRLVGIAETKNIVKTADGAEADGKHVDIERLVSMNFWCYPAEFLDVLKIGFPEFLKTTPNIEKDEYLLPIIADGMLKEGTEFTVLPTDDQWFGVTYREDKPTVEAAFRNLIEDGEYKADLYSNL